MQRRLATTTTTLLSMFVLALCSLEQAAAQLEPQVRLAKVNTEDEQQLAARFNIRSIPTLLIFKDGKVADQIVGAVPKAILKRKIDKVLEA